MAILGQMLKNAVMACCAGNVIMIKFLKVGFRPLVRLLFFLSGLTKRNERIWLFCAWRGNGYLDNSKYLFEYVNQCQPGITAVWISKNRNVVAALRKEGRRAYVGWSPMAVYYTLLGGTVFETEGVQDIPAPCKYLIKGIRTVMMWHGGIPIKQCTNWLTTGRVQYDNQPWSNRFGECYWTATSR